MLPVSCLILFLTLINQNHSKAETLTMIKICICKIFLLSSIIIVNGNEKVDLTFPSEFLIGTAISAYQVEGAWNLDGKGESNWDNFVHNFPTRMANKSTGDTAIDFYHKYPEDIKLLKEIGFNHFRFSISWSRIFPNGYAVNPNKIGVQYYHSILDELEKQQIIPFVTIYHWDHPQVLEKIGGWLNEEMAFIFAEYATFIFEEFGSRVKTFITFNEANIFCPKAYGSTVNPPGANLTEYGEYLCVQNMLKGHAMAYDVYRKNFSRKQNGQIGIVTSSNCFYPKNKNDTTSVDIAFDFSTGWIMNPIFSKTGDYPEIMKSRIGERSRLQGYGRSRLPRLSKSWIEMIRGSADFLGINYYTSRLVEPFSSVSPLNWPNDTGLNATFDPSWPSSDVEWIKVVPQGLGDILRKIKTRYDNPPVYILEIGVADNNKLDDNLRIDYFYSHMKEVLTAIKRDNCPVKAFTTWSLLDNLEWESGYIPKFGLIDINFNDKNLTRTLKKSALWMKSLLKSRKLQAVY